MTERGNRKIQSPKLDMNPMVDMAFLLVTFFLLATTFKVPDQAYVNLPRARTEIDLPEKKLLTITVDIDGKVFIHLSNKPARAEWLRRISAAHNTDLSADQVRVFSELPGFGLPFKDLINYIKLERKERIEIIQTGIPTDSTDNELQDWLLMARAVQPGLRFAIKADQKTPYKHIQTVIKTLTTNKILRFNLVTEKRLDGAH
jgi:biopolymer transport protein ExbD